MEKFKKEVVIEVRNYIIGIALEGGKGEDPKNRLFLIPFVSAFIIILFLFVSVFIP